ncbi:hypothetical protein IFM89_020649 [Coptis chinensis]|uniref:Uncharacterized protein n=1 Tax=Coptis chinensis TaxID=261450 RepID=A0A835I9E1_9MAGN|nr:hypothetical protein IFM89_020649 [Coptis chinensis]
MAATTPYKTKAGEEHKSRIELQKQMANLKQVMIEEKKAQMEMLTSSTKREKVMENVKYKYLYEIRSGNENLKQKNSLSPIENNVTGLVSTPIEVENQKEPHVEECDEIAKAAKNGEDSSVPNHQEGLVSNESRQLPVLDPVILQTKGRPKDALKNENTSRSKRWKPLLR